MATTQISPSRRFSHREILTIAFPILLSSLVEQIVGMTDTAFLGRVGEIELGASALGGIFFISVFMLIWGFCSGAQILMGRRNGEQNFADIGTVFYHSLGFLLLLSTLILIATLLFAPTVLRLIISSPEVCDAAWDYLYWRIWGIHFTMVAVLFRAFYVATTRTGVLQINSVVMVACNVLFDYLLIFGHWGFPELGIAGAAIASSLSSAFSMLFFIVYTLWRGDAARYALDRLPRFRPRLLGKMLNVSVWMMVQSFLSLSTWFMFFIAIEHLGSRELAVTNVMRSISGFTYMSLMAFASTASTLTSNLIGASNFSAVRPMIGRIVRLAAYLLIPTWVIICLFPTAVLSIFTNDATLIAAGIVPLWVLGSSYLFQIPAQILFMSVSGTGNTRTALWVEIFSLIIYCTFVWGMVLQLRCNLAVAWTSEIIYAFFILLPSYAYMRWGKWHRKQI